MKGVTLPTETVFVMEASPIKFGLGATDEIAYDARRLGLRRVLIVTDRHIGELGLPETQPGIEPEAAPVQAGDLAPAPDSDDKSPEQAVPAEAATRRS